MSQTVTDHECSNQLFQGNCDSMKHSTAKEGKANRNSVVLRLISPHPPFLSPYSLVTASSVTLIGGKFSISHAKSRKEMREIWYLDTWTFYLIGVQTISTLL